MHHMPASKTCPACPVCVLAEEEADFSAKSSSEEDLWEFCATCKLQARRVVTQEKQLEKPLWGTAWKNRVLALVSAEKPTGSAPASALASAPASAPALASQPSLQEYLGSLAFGGCAPNPENTIYRLSEFLDNGEEQRMQSGHQNTQGVLRNEPPLHRLQLCLPNFENDIKFIMTQYVALATMNKLIGLATQGESIHTSLFDAVNEAHQRDLISDEQRDCLRSLNRAGNEAKHRPLWTTSVSASRRVRSQPPKRQPYRQ